MSELHSHDILIPAIPPFYWSRYAHLYTKASRVVKRPPEALFYQNEQAYYLAFARELGYPAIQWPLYCLPRGPSEGFSVTGRTLAIAPGCKTGEMAAKRWPYFPQLAERFEDVVIVGTEDDLCHRDGTIMQFPPHARRFVGALTLRETAELLASVGVVVGNDSGLAHIWRMEDWRELARLVYRHLGLVLIIVGAAYDKSYSDQVLTSESLSDICVLDRVGQWDIHETFRVCQGAKFVVSYQSGIGIFSTYMCIPVAMW